MNKNQYLAFIVFEASLLGCSKRCRGGTFYGRVSIGNE